MTEITYTSSGFTGQSDRGSFYVNSYFYKTE